MVSLAPVSVTSSTPLTGEEKSWLKSWANSKAKKEWELSGKGADGEETDEDFDGKHTLETKKKNEDEAKTKEEEAKNKKGEEGRESE